MIGRVKQKLWEAKMDIVCQVVERSDLFTSKNSKIIFTSSTKKSENNSGYSQ